MFKVMIIDNIVVKKRYKLEDIVEVLDCQLVHTRRLARITGMIADRVHITYIGKLDKDGIRESIRQ